NHTYSWMSRVFHRLAHRAVQRSFEVTFSFTGKPVKDFVAAAAKQLVKPARDAAYALVDGTVVTTHSHAGQAVKYFASRELLKGAVTGTAASVTLSLERVAPKVPDAAVGKLIVVSRTENRLWLYDGFRVERTYPVA